MSNKHFDKLSIKSSYEKNNHVYWICECECGNIVLLTKQEIITNVCSRACLASRGEICAADLFNELGVKYQVQKKFQDFDLRFDFYLPDYNVVIECDGAQHFRALNSEWDSRIKLQETRERDIRKKQYCEENGIILLQIPFWDTKKLNLEYLREVINEINN